MSRRHNRHSSQGSTHDSHQPLSTEGRSAAGAGRSHELPAEHRRGLLPELYFRWRAGEITRLEAFCDVVFGFALTLLVVSLEVPRSYGELMAAMRGFLPFAICFAQLVMIWRAHYKFSRRYGLEDAYTVFLNLVLLFLVLFYVYPLKFVFTLVFSQLMGSEVARNVGRQEACALMRIYSIGFTSVFSLFALMYAHAYRFRDALELSPAEAMQTRVEIQENVIMAVVGAVSFALTFKDPGWAGWWYFVIGPALGIHGSIYGKRVRLLAEKA
jgi:uncharacterized membrane protein